MANCQWLNYGHLTLYFSPKASGKIECVCIIGDGELPGIASCASEKADLILRIESSAMAETRQRDVAENI